MGFGELEVDTCSYNSHSTKTDHFEQIWKYENAQKYLFLSVVGHKNNTST